MNNLKDNKVETSFKVHGIGISWQSPDKSLTDFINRNYKIFISDAEQKSSLEISITRNKKDYQAIQQVGEADVDLRPLFSHLGAYCNTSASSKNEHLRISALYQEPIYTKLISLVNRKTFIGQMNQRLMRYLVHFPLFWLLEQRGFGFIHAAAIAKDDQAIVFVGANGSGKTTLALSLLNQGYQLLSDNFLLFKDDRIYAFPEVTRISSKSAELLNMPISGPSIFGKYHVNLKPEQIARSARLKHFFYVEPAEHQKFSVIDSQAMLEKILHMQESIKEFHYDSPLIALDKFSDQPMTRETRNNRIRQFISLGPTSLLDYDRPMTLNKISDKITKYVAEYT